MKKMMTGALSLFVSSIAVAQMPSITLDTTNKKSQLSRTLRNNLLSQSNFSHTTSKGKIYILPYDNMPCLVPDMRQSARMPGSSQPMPESRMPNAIPRRELIPKQKKP